MAMMDPSRATESDTAEDDQLKAIDQELREIACLREQIKRRGRRDTALPTRLVRH